MNEFIDRDPMPVFSVKAKDVLAPTIIAEYLAECVRRGWYEQAGEVVKALSETTSWQLRNPDQVKRPDHKHVPARPRFVVTPEDLGEERRVEIEVEPDVDPQDTPTEGALWVREA